MVSVISIFIFASQLSAKIEINRVMQENIKNVIETIAEDVRENGVSGVSASKPSPDCTLLSPNLSVWDKLCTRENEYFLATYDKTLDVFIRADLWVGDCSDVVSECVLVKKTPTSLFPLTNSFISFRDMKFYATGNEIPKVTLTFHVQPSLRKWVRANLIQENEIFFQTTISERLIDLN